MGTAKKEIAVCVPHQSKRVDESRLSPANLTALRPSDLRSDFEKGPFCQDPASCAFP
jgi:hypothetical protein